MHKPNAYKVFTKVKDEHIEHHQPKLFCLLEKKPIYIGMDRREDTDFWYDHP